MYIHTHDEICTQIKFPFNIVCLKKSLHSLWVEKTFYLTHAAVGCLFTNFQDVYTVHVYTCILTMHILGLYNVILCDVV